MLLFKHKSIREVRHCVIVWLGLTHSRRPSLAQTSGLIEILHNCLDKPFLYGWAQGYWHSKTGSQCHSVTKEWSKISVFFSSVQTMENSWQLQISKPNHQQKVIVHFSWGIRKELFYFYFFLQEFDLFCWTDGIPNHFKQKLDMHHCLYQVK